MLLEAEMQEKLHINGVENTCLGIDIGSTTAKLVLVENGNVIYEKYERHLSQARSKTIEMINEIEHLLKGKKIYFNPEFMSSLSQDEQVFVFAHEICHIALNHIKRGKDKDKKIWNIATDAIINATLENDGLVMPENGIRIFGAMNKDAEELYEILLKEKEENKEKENDSNFDDHDIWDDKNDIYNNINKYYLEKKCCKTFHFVIKKWGEMFLNLAVY